MPKSTPRLFRTICGHFQLKSCIENILGTWVKECSSSRDLRIRGGSYWTFVYDGIVVIQYFDGYTRKHETRLTFRIDNEGECGRITISGPKAPDISYRIVRLTRKRMLWEIDKCTSLSEPGEAILKKFLLCA